MKREQRNLLRNAVVNARRLLETEFQEQLEGAYNILPDGQVLENSPGDPIVRKQLLEVIEHHCAGGASARKAVERTVRESAFTVLNRFAAIKAAERRGLVRESVSKGLLSEGMRELAECAPGLRGSLEDGGYRLLLEAVMDEISLDLKALFNRRDATAPLWPRPNALDELLQLLNDPELADLWSEDEAIGWIYQYFNADDVKQMRKASTAPRDSRELAVRNQFFTPRYVVEFLTDNTLGRVWYEMNRGETRLRDECSFQIRRPNEIFLIPGEGAPGRSPRAKTEADPAQEVVFVPHRSLKDPREIRVLDPACGSMHFGLYAFELFETIYEEAWDIAHAQGAEESSADFRPFVSLVTEYPDKAHFLADVPRLIIEQNLHGIDIDPRAVQIAGLSLWLRAHRTWQEKQVSPSDRPSVRRSNIVCADPMPGEEALLDEFIDAHLSATGEQRLLAQLVRRVFESMKFAGEMGSLLRIEEEVLSAVAEARELWLKSPRVEQGRLFPDDPSNSAGEIKGLDVAGITDESFWVRAEEAIYAALQAYTQHASQSVSYQRRLFVDDIAQGFAFIDVCRKRYDVVLMNPPFGQGPKAVAEYLNSRYVGSGVDELAASFYTRALELLEPAGRIGEISSRTCFFLPTLADWRKEVVFERSTLVAYADLGENVLDGAVNETAAYVVQKEREVHATCLFGMFHREEHIDRALAELAACTLGPRISIRPLTDFEVLDDRPLSYWTSNAFVRALPQLRPLGEAAADVQMGLAPRDEFRFSRLWWEVRQEDIGAAGTWLGYAKGGELSPYYSDVELVLNARDDLREIRAALNKKYPYLKGNLSWVLHPENDYFASGLTFGQRTTFLRMSALPSGCYFSVAGKAVFGREQSSEALLQAINTPAAQFLVSLRREFLAINPQYQEGDVARMPWPKMSSEASRKLEEWGRESSVLVRSLASFDETDHAFQRVSLDGDARWAAEVAAESIAQNEANANEVVSGLLSLSGEDFQFIDREIMPKWHSRSVANWYEANEPKDLVSFALGAAFGRWDIQIASGEVSPPALLDIFSPLPACAPAQLSGDGGMPLSRADEGAFRSEGRWTYPLEIPWDGVLVDDPGHSLDIETRVHGVLEAVWKERSTGHMQETCDALGIRSPREYLRKPNGFFADHLKRYSKSRRKAPIYWPLSTASGSYTAWIYYNRLTPDTLFQVIVDFLDPKLRDVAEQQIQTEAAQARAEGREAARIAKQAVELGALAQELGEMKAELLSIAELPYKPHLNDGVQISAAPLWKLFRHTKWRKDLEATWKKLEKGEFDWAHLAYAIWPERVREKCKTDRSLAIAHGLEDLCEVEVVRKKKPRSSEGG